jgi:SNF2 family DNA or RNA helicase
VLLPDSPEPERVLSYVRPSKVVQQRNGNLAVVARHNSDTVVRMREIGITCPSSISTRYNWPGRYTPFDHQYTCAEFLTLHRKCCNLSDMATGKTAAALWAADWLMREGLVRRALVIATLSTVVSVWEREMFTVIPHRSATVLHAARAKRQRMARENMDDFFIVNHDGLTVVKKLLLERGDIDLVIYDEASALKNGQTTRFKELREFVNKTQCRLWLLTGTPAAQSPTDAWALGRLVNPFDINTNPTGAPTSFVKFRDSCMKQQGPFKWVARPNANIVVRQVLQPAIRFKKEDCIDLPEVVYMDRHASLSPSQERAFADMKKEFQAQALTDKGEGVEVTAINAAVKLSKLLQICSGAAYTEDGRIATFDMPNRLAVVEELIDQAAKKVIVFIPFRHALERVQGHLVSVGITCAVMHGGVTGKARDMLIKNFMDSPDPRVLIAHPKTASHGLNFTCADTTIWFGPTFSAELYQQANERMARPGQDSKMAIVHLSSTEIEQKAFQLLYDRQVTQQGLLSLYEETIGVKK